MQCHVTLHAETEARFREVPRCPHRNLPPPARVPIFFHCGWRTRGTWIWNRARTEPGVTGYYEPLSETLGTIRSDTLARFNADSWPSGHPDLDRPYFEEFKPLMRRARSGVQGYKRKFATADFFASPEAVLPDLEAYLRNLILTSQRRDEQPVLKLCRSVGRLDWMRRRFPDVAHVVVLRNPLSQFDSARWQFLLHGNASFLSTPLMLLAANRELPVISACARHLKADLPDLSKCATPERRLAACEAQIRRTGPSMWYRNFLAFWAVAAAGIPESIDLVINGDLLVKSDSYRRDCEVRLADRNGHLFDFSDARRSSEMAGPEDLRPPLASISCANRDAEAFLREQIGIGWRENLAQGQVGMLIAEADSLADNIPVQTRKATDWSPVSLGPDRNTDAILTAVMRRAVRAEEELARLCNSKSWRITAPLRLLFGHLSAVVAFAVGLAHSIGSRSIKTNARHKDGGGLLSARAALPTSSK